MYVAKPAQEFDRVKWSSLDLAIGIIDLWKPTVPQSRQLLHG